MIHVTEGVTSIEVAPDGFPYFSTDGYVSPLLQERSGKLGASTGARVTVEFARGAPLPPHTDIRVHFDIAENGELREIRGIPQLTHTSARHDAGAAFHYRLSHWIPAPSVMQFVQA